MNAEQQHKNCPSCGEQIQIIAIKCKHCHTDLTFSKVDFSLWILGLPVLSILLTWFWVGEMSLLNNPSGSLGLITVITIVGTAILCAIEASKVGMKTDRSKGTYSSVAWFFLIIFMWGICYPIYAYKRKHYQLRSRLIPALIITVLFTMSIVSMAGLIENQRNEVLTNLQNISNQTYGY